MVMYSSGVGVRFPSPVGYRGGAPLIGGAVGGATAGAPASVGDVGASSAMQVRVPGCSQSRRTESRRESSSSSDFWRSSTRFFFINSQLLLASSHVGDYTSW